MRRAAGLAASGLLATAVAVPPVVASDSAPTGGRAASSGTILEATIAGTTIAIGVDELSATRAEEATAALTLGRSGTDEVGTVRAKSKDGSQRAQLGPDSVMIDGLLSITGAEGVAEAGLDGDERATSTVSTTLSNAQASDVGGAGLIAQTAEAFAGTARSLATRTITIADATILTIGDLLDVLGIGVLSLACERIEAIATTLGTSASAACALLADVDAQLAAAGTLLQGAELDAIGVRDATQLLIDAQTPLVEALQTGVDTLTAQRDDLASQAAGLIRGDLEAQLADTLAEIGVVEPTCTTLGLLCDVLADLTAARDELTTQLGLLDDLDAAGADLDAALDELAVEQAVLDALLDTLANANSILSALATIDLGGLPTCADGLSALDDVAGVTPALAGAAATLRDALDTVCDALAGAIDTLLGTPLLSLSGVEITLDTLAERDYAEAVIDGTIGSIVVGALPPVAIDVPLAGAATALDDAADSVEADLDDVLSALGLDAPGLSVTLFDLERATNVAADGSSSAMAALTAVALRVPELTVAFPSATPLGSLAGLLPEGTETPGSQTIDAFDLDVAVFEASSAFPVRALSTNPPPPGGGGGGGGEELPTLGVGSAADWAAILFVLAGLGARWMRRRPLAA